MIDLKNLFAARMEADLAERELTHEQRIMRGRLIKELVSSEGFVALEKFVASMQGTTQDEIANSKDALEVMKHQGEFIGVVALRRAVLAILNDADDAKQELEREIEELKENPKK